MGFEKSLIFLRDIKASESRQRARKLLPREDATRGRNKILLAGGNFRVRV